MKVVVDQMQRSVEIVDFPQRIVSLVPSQTELLHYLGLGERVIGITKFCVHPEVWYRSKKRVGGTKQVKFDIIEALQPDLIIGNKEENMQADIEQLEQQYPVWMSDMQTLDEVWDMMNGLGKMLDVEAKMTALIQHLKDDLKALKEEVQQQKRLKIAYFIWQNPYMIAASNTFIDTMLDLAGFDNAFADLMRYPSVEAIDIQAVQPDAMFLSSEPFPFKEKHVQQFREIYPHCPIEIVDGEIFSWYGSRMLHFVDYVKKLRQKLEH